MHSKRGEINQSGRSLNSISRKTKESYRCGLLRVERGGLGKKENKKGYEYQPYGHA